MYIAVNDGDEVVQKLCERQNILKQEFIPTAHEARIYAVLRH